MEGNTATLRSSAAQWSLAGDKQLLDILNNIHQSLVTRCQEVNKKLDEMVSALDGASVDLQNVNNKFMALSNSQFIESRVYDDDVDIASQVPPKEAPKVPSTGDDISKLKQSVATLVAAHETIEILASDSDDDDDDEARMVLKPIDMYAHRPLPYIIGSQNWRNKWHAGLHPEDSDSDSSISKRDREEDDYSDSEPEMSSQPAAPLEREESTASSELPSEQDIGLASAPTAGIKPAPADIAAELARRLGGQHVQIPFQEPVYSPPNPASRKVYRPEQPIPGTIFSDEPPPLDQSDRSDSPDDDIFAELHKSQPNVHSNKVQSRLAEDLFAGLGGYEEGDVFSDFKDDQPSSNPTPKPKSTLFSDESEPELFEKPQPAPGPDVSKPEVENVKKPIGGISLFGNTKGAESIGAAILRRNRQKSSSDEETVEETSRKQEIRATSKEKDIFDDLFAKSEKEQKRNTKKIEEKVIKEVETPKTKVDLFSDNIFDDIDDIFTTNITKTVKNDKSNTKSLFEDDDDIFSDIAVSKTSGNSKVDSKIVDEKKKNIFDSDDDLFSEVPNKENKVSVKEITKMEETNKETKSNVFGNEDEDISTKSDIKNDNVTVNTNIFNEITSNKVLINNHNSAKNDDNLNSIINPRLEKEAANIVHENDNSKSAAKSIFDDDDSKNDDLFSSIATKSSRSDNYTLTVAKHQKKPLFDDDSDDNDLFGTKLPEPDKKDKHSINNNNAPHYDEIKTVLNQKSALFDDMETDDLFGSSSKQLNIENKVASNDKNETPKKETETIDNKKESLFDDEEEALFGASNKKTIQDKPKPELKKKPTMTVRNTKNIAKELDENKTIDQKEKIKQGNIDKDKKYDRQNKQSSNGSGQDIFGSKANEPQQQISKQDKVNPNTEKIESQFPPTEANINPVIAEKKLEVQEVKEETQSPVVEEKVATITNQSNLDQKHEKIESILPETHTEVPPPFEATDNNDDDIFADHPIDSRTKQEQLLTTPNVFDDIFSEPPAFEKPTEPKKSKNINALFDDDSDDEALFFKKNDPVIDEKPDLSPDTSREVLFGIFHDEPPAIEVDFTQKPTNSNIEYHLLRTDSDDELFSTPNKHQKEALDSVPKTEFGTIDNEQTHKEDNISKVEKPVISDRKPQIEKSKSFTESQKDVTDEPKKVGKLKTMNFNIDVSTLLPGASPKKKAAENLDTKSSEDIHQTENKKSVEQIDGQTFTKSSEDLHFQEKIEPIMTKSVSFEGEPDSQVLDNKISKERAKIQVKRRPSTRRARKEAVRKSAIDFGDDSTDNSSSIDDPPRKPHVEQRTTTVRKETEKKYNDFDVKLPKTDDFEDVILKTEEDKVETNEIQTKADVKVPEEKVLGRSSDEVDFEEKFDKTTDHLEPNAKEFDDIIENITNIEEKQSSVDLGPEIKDIKPKFLEEIKPESKLDSPKTTKIVYILNDEDIFSNPVEKSEVKSRTIDDDDHLFQNTSKTSEVKPNISTLGNVYKDISNVETKTSNKVSEKHKKSLFEDLSDDDNELFKTNKKTALKSKGILDSDSEEDLFGAKKKETTDTKATIVKEKENTKVEVKSSLFGDDDDDDDLFGAKVKNMPASSAQPTRSTREVTKKPAEPVFDDPLSLLGGVDD